MDLTQEQTFQIQNKVYCLGNPVVTVETLEALVNAMTACGDATRPIVIINPTAETIPNFDELLENYIEHNLLGNSNQVTTSYMLHAAVDDEIRTLAEEQYRKDGTPIEYSIEMYTLIREQSTIKSNIDALSAEADALWRAHCANPNSMEGSDRYVEVTTVLLPQAQKALDEITAKIAALPPPVREPIPVAPQVNTESQVQQPTIPETKPVDDDLPPWDIDEPDTIEKTVSASIPAEQWVDQLSTDGVSITEKWLSADKFVMPLSAAKEKAQSQGYVAIRNQQLKQIPGYKSVPLEYLIMLGVPVYPDGTTIVYTRAGEFMRVGEADVSVLNNNFWFPRPILEF